MQHSVISINKNITEVKHLALDVVSCWTQTQFVSFSPDRLLRGEKLPGPLVRVHQRLLWNRLSPEPMQLLQGGERDVHGLWPAQLHGPAVPADHRGVPRVSEHHRLQWLHPVLPHYPRGKYAHQITKRGETGQAVMKRGSLMGNILT